MSPIDVYLLKDTDDKQQGKRKRNDYSSGFTTVGLGLPLWDWARRVEIETTFEYTQSCVKLVTPLSIEDTAGT